MAKFFRARRAREVRAFLEAHAFYFAANDGDDDIYARQGYGYTVKIPNRDNDEIPIGTMSQIRKCVRMCGVSDKLMLEWWKENGYGD